MRLVLQISFLLHMDAEYTHCLKYSVKLLHVGSAATSSWREQDWCSAATQAV